MRRLAAILCLALGAPVALQPQDASVAQLRTAVEAIDRGDGAAAQRTLAPLARRFPAIADYTAFWTAQALALQEDHAAAASAVEPVFRQQPESPLAGRAAVLAASSLLEIGNAQGALTALSRVPELRLPQPEALAVMARAREAVGDRAASAIAWQAVYFQYPASSEASDASAALSRLEAAMDSAYPPPMPGARLDRAGRLATARRFSDARSEYLEMVPLLDGAARETARVRAASMLHRARRDADAYNELNSLELQDTAARAERLHWLAAASLRLDRTSAMEDALLGLATVAPDSDWRLRSLVTVADSYLVDNRVADYLPHYTACADAFPGQDRAAYCHWKVAWAAWLARSPRAVELFKDHLRRFPSSEKAGAALYWLGQSSLTSGDLASARDYLAELNKHFPNFFYSTFARRILEQSDVRNAPAPSPAQAFLASLKLPDRDRSPDFTASPTALKRIDRAQLLRQAGLERWAETELRFAARNGDSPWALAIHLAETAAARGDFGMSVRYIKGTVPGYLFLPRDAAPARFWRLAFPFPYRASIEKYARERGIDPFLLAALIRQESEFDPKVKSSAGAIGLTQIMPPTGRSLARRLKVGYRTANLTLPDYNLRLGTFYLSNLITSFDGRIEDVLAAYNAGPGRPKKWRQWAEFRDPQEFVETIPFTQTRDYVQIILRNAEVYRWLYAGTKAESEPAAKPAAKTSPSKKKQSAKKSPSGKKSK